MAPPPSYDKAATSGLESDLNDDDTCFSMMMTLAPYSNHFSCFNYFTPFLLHSIILLLLFYTFNLFSCVIIILIVLFNFNSQFYIYIYFMLIFIIL